MEDEILPDEYEAEEILDGFTEESPADDPEAAEEEDGQTKVVRRETETWEKTIPYQIIRR